MKRRVEKNLAALAQGMKNANRAFRKWRLAGGPRLLVYADSRGDNIPGHKNYAHYPERLAQRYYVDAYLAPEKWTMIPDFLQLYQQLQQPYDVIILHAGAVDAAPRHRRNLLEVIYPQKQAILDDLFGASTIQAHLQGSLGVEYEGDQTNNLYSLEMARTHLLPRLQAIPNLIWIGGNRIVPGWQGNYWKARPANIALIEDYARLFAAEIPCAGTTRVVDPMQWSLEEVQQYTFDNIHPNQAGSDWIYAHLLLLIEEIIRKPGKRPS